MGFQEHFWYIFRNQTVGGAKVRRRRLDRRPLEESKLERQDRLG
jgi:hypothetical protein